MINYNNVKYDSNKISADGLVQKAQANALNVVSKLASKMFGKGSIGAMFNSLKL